MKRDMEKTSCIIDGKDFVKNTHNGGEKKIKLFGIELDTVSRKFLKENKGNNVECDESVNSSPSSTISSGLGGERILKDSSCTMVEPPVPPPEDTKDKFKCQYCFKRFANSQALGGHQNAHKRERLRKQRLQLQARRANINYYLQPYKNNPSFDYHISSTWSFDPSITMIDQSPLYEEEQICFSHCGQDRWYVPFPQQGRKMFTLTRPISAKSEKTCCHLDLQLGLKSSSVSECNHFPS